MTVVLRHSEQIELNLVEYTGSVSLAELVALADFQAAQPAMLSYDSISVVRPGADFRSVELSNLDEVFARYRELFRPLNLVILRRSAWICQSPAAEPHVRHWLGDRDTRGGLSSDVRRFESFTGAADWLLLDAEELAALDSGAGFVDLARYHIPPAPALAR